MSAMSDQGVALVAVTPADSDLARGPCKGLIVAVSGDLSIKSYDNTDSGTFAVVAGQVIPVRVRQVKAATTATVLAVY